MANLAFGGIEITSSDKGLLQNLRKVAENSVAFAYDGSEPEFYEEENLLEICFWGAWNCTKGFDVIEELLDDPNYPHQAALVLADVYGWQDEQSWLCSTFSKKPGDKHFTYCNLHDGVYTICDALKHFVPYLPAAGRTMEFGVIELKVVSKRKVKASSTVRCKIYIATECDDRTFVFDILENGDLLEVDSWRGEVRHKERIEEEEEEEVEEDRFENESDVINSIMFYCARQKHYK